MPDIINGDRVATRIPRSEIERQADLVGVASHHIVSITYDDTGASVTLLRRDDNGFPIDATNHTHATSTIVIPWEW